MRPVDFAAKLRNLFLRMPEFRKRSFGAADRTVLPIGVGVMPRAWRSKSAAPTSRSSSRMLRVSAGCATCKLRAAACMPPYSATAKRSRS